MSKFSCFFTELELSISSVVLVVVENFFFCLFIKEPKEEEMTEEEKAAQKARPIATNPIPGTPWYAHYKVLAVTQILCFPNSSASVCLFLWHIQEQL